MFEYLNNSVCGASGRAGISGDCGNVAFPIKPE